MALAALQPIMTDFIDMPAGALAQGDRILAEFAVDGPSGLAGQELGDAMASCQDVVVLAIRDSEGKMTVGPAGSTRLNPGDSVMVVGSEDELRSFGGRGRVG